MQRSGGRCAQPFGDDRVGRKQPNFETIWRLANALGLPPHSLVERIEQEAAKRAAESRAVLTCPPRPAAGCVCDALGALPSVRFAVGVRLRPSRSFLCGRYALPFGGALPNEVRQHAVGRKPVKTVQAFCASPFAGIRRERRCSESRTGAPRGQRGIVGR